MKVNKFVLFISVFFLAILFAIPLGKLYLFTFLVPQGFYSFAIPLYLYNFFDGFMSAFIFFLTLLFTAFGGAKKYWWIGILLIPAALFEAYFDLPHIYFPAVLGVIGWFLGLLLFKIVNRAKIV